MTEILHMIDALLSSMWFVHVHECTCTPDASHPTTSSCRDWLLLRLDRHDCRKLMSEPSRIRCTFSRCCAEATLEDTLHQSSVVGYKCKTIQYDNTKGCLLYSFCIIRVLYMLHFSFKVTATTIEQDTGNASVIATDKGFHGWNILFPSNYFFKLNSSKQVRIKSSY